MNNSKLLLLGLLITGLTNADVRVRISLGAGHPIARPGKTVVVRRAPVVVKGPVTYAAPVVWAPTRVVVPSRDRLVFQDSEVIRRPEDWVDTSLQVNNRGKELVLGIAGQAQLDFAEVHFGNGRVQVVDFRDRAVEKGAFRLLDFPDGSLVTQVRIVAKARSPQARLNVFLLR